MSSSGVTLVEVSKVLVGGESGYNETSEFFGLEWVLRGGSYSCDTDYVYTRSCDGLYFVTIGFRLARTMRRRVVISGR